MPVQRKHNLARIDQHSVAPCSFVAVCGLLAGVAANKGNVRGPLVAVKRLRQESAQSKVPLSCLEKIHLCLLMLDSKIYLSSYNPQCREMSGKHKRRKFANLFYHSTLSTKTKIVLLPRNNSQSERSFVPGFIYCYCVTRAPLLYFIRS